MPYVGEHAFRVKDPDQFDSFARKNDEFGTGIDVIYGIKKDYDISEVQAIRFDADIFTFDEAEKWMRDHDWSYIKAEPAIKEDKSFRNKPISLVERLIKSRYYYNNRN